MPKCHKDLKTGYTTGACAAAAARAATIMAIMGREIQKIAIVLPNRNRAVFHLHNKNLVSKNKATATVIKDAGDDPDCTHGAEIVAEVTLNNNSGVTVLGGEGVAVVTKPGLGLVIGEHAINPVPKQNIRDMVQKILDLFNCSGAEVVISVPRGIEIAKDTSNENLGLIGGISILGTSGIVYPYSTAAYKASIVKQISVISESEDRVAVLTTGTRTEEFAKREFKEFSETSFVRCGDYLNVGLRNSAIKSLDKVIVVLMVGKLSKLANNEFNTHIRKSKVSVKLLNDILLDLLYENGIDLSEELLLEVKSAKTARRFLEISTGLSIDKLFCNKLLSLAGKNLGEYLEHKLPSELILIDFSGKLNLSYKVN